MESKDLKNQIQEQPKKGSDRKRLIVILFLQFAAIVVLGWLYFNQTKKVEKEIEEKIVYIDKSNGFQAELAALKEDYLTLETEDQAVKKELSDKISQIEDLQKQAEKHKNDAYVIGKLKKEAATLRSIMKSFVTTIDSLNTLNQTITAEKKKVEEDLFSEKDKTTKLSKEKEDLQGVVAIGSMLKAQNLSATGIRAKSGGKKEDETGKAKKTEKIKVSFILSENLIAKSGPKNIYVQLLSPDGKEISKTGEEAEMFSLPNGTRTFYAGMKSVDYTNQEVSVSVYCESKTGFMPGKYILKVYNDGSEIGQTSLELE